MADHSACMKCSSLNLVDVFYTMSKQNKLKRYVTHGLMTGEKHVHEKGMMKLLDMEIEFTKIVDSRRAIVVMRHERLTMDVP